LVAETESIINHNQKLQLWHSLVTDRCCYQIKRSAREMIISSAYYLLKARSLGTAHHLMTVFLFCILTWARRWYTMGFSMHKLNQVILVETK